jgi:hypothetical protein
MFQCRYRNIFFKNPQILNQSWLKSVNLPQEKVFSQIRNISKLQTLFPDKYKSFKILEESDDRIEEIVSISGKEIKQKVKHILEPNRLLKSEIIEGGY